MQRHDQNSHEQVGKSLELVKSDTSTSLQVASHGCAASGVERANKPIYSHSTLPIVDPQLTAQSAQRAAHSTTGFAPAPQWTEDLAAWFGAQYEQQYLLPPSYGQGENFYTTEMQPRNYRQIYNPPHMTANQSMHGLHYYPVHQDMHGFQVPQSQSTMEQAGLHYFHGMMPMPSQPKYFTTAAEPGAAPNVFHNPLRYQWETDLNDSRHFAGLGGKQLHPSQMRNNNAGRIHAQEQQKVPAVNDNPERNLNTPRTGDHWDPRTPFHQLDYRRKRAVFVAVTQRVRNFLNQFPMINEKILGNKMGIPQPLIRELLIPAKDLEDLSRRGLSAFVIMDEWERCSSKLSNLLAQLVVNECKEIDKRISKKRQGTAHSTEESPSCSKSAAKKRRQNSKKTAASHLVGAVQSSQRSSTSRHYYTKNQQQNFDTAASERVLQFPSQSQTFLHDGASQLPHRPTMPTLDHRNPNRPSLPGHLRPNFAQGNYSESFMPIRYQTDPAASRQNVSRNMPGPSRVSLGPPNSKGKLLPSRRQTGTTVIGQASLQNAPMQSRPSVAHSNASEPSKVNQQQTDVVVTLPNVIEKESSQSNVGSPETNKRQANK